MMNAHIDTQARHDPDQLELEVVRKTRARLIPFLLLMYLIAYVDRTNVSFAQIQFKQDLGFSGAAYGLGAGIFFVGYLLFEVPSNLVLYRIGARIWLARIMVTWGIVAALMMFIRTPMSFYALRFLLGVAEAGFVPGVLLYLTYWFPAMHRGRIMSLFLLGIPLALIFGSPSAGLLLTLDGVAGLRGWQWLFLVEGVLSVLVGICAFFYLPEGPDRVAWLESTEKTWLAQRLKREEDARLAEERLSVAQSFRNPRVLLISLAYFCMTVAQFGIIFWLPPTVKQLGVSGVAHIGLIAAVPWIFTLIGLLILGHSSDRCLERKKHIVAGLVCTALGLIVCGLLFEQHPALALVALCVGAFGFGTHAVFWALSTSFLSGAARASGIAIINSIGTFGGFVGPYLLGLIVDATGSTMQGLFVLSAAAIVGAVLIMTIRHNPDLERARTISGVG
ncbi:MFS transporter [Paraburkholderia sp.]|uniref:MFS transporter n=1 Tax=Paraburkholderia sp. TaxID=1926495 RepID=UPI0039E4FBBD